MPAQSQATQRDRPARLRPLRRLHHGRASLPGGTEALLGRPYGIDPRSRAGVRHLERRANETAGPATRIGRSDVTVAVSGSEYQPASELDSPHGRAGGEAGDAAERRRAERRVRVAEVRAVEDVVTLRPELEADVLAERDVLHQGDVRLLEVRAAKDVARRVAERELRGQCEPRRVVAVDELAPRGRGGPARIRLAIEVRDRADEV